MTIEMLINRVLFKSELINTSCEYYAIADKDLIIKFRLPRIKIPPKPVTGFIKENIKEPGVEITKIVKFSINIKGYRWNIFTYIVPILLNPIIIGLPQINEDNIIIRPATDTLIINSYGLIILTKEIPVLLEIKKLVITCHGAICMQANGAEGRKNDRFKKERKGI